jgi:hypothetical protein
MRSQVIVSTLLLLIFLGACRANAQSTEEMEKKYPSEPEVMLENSNHYSITIVNDMPQVQSTIIQRFFYLSSQAGAYLSHYRIYHSSFHQLQQYSAYTVTANAKKIKVTDFKTTDSKSAGIFYDDVKETSFDFPAIAPGATGTLETSLLHNDAHMLSPFFFSRGIPVVDAELKITFPKEITVKYVLKGIDTGAIAVTKETRRGECVWTFRMKDLAADQSYGDAPESDWYDPHVIFYIGSFVNSKGQVVRWLGEPEDLYRLYLGYLRNIDKEAGPMLKSVVDSLCAGLKTPEEKTRKIYGWVQQNIKYVAFEQGMEGFVPRDGNLVCDRRFGDCKDMASILTLMLRTAGVPAYFTWVGTRDLPYTYSETPLPLVDNHMICTTVLNGKYTFLDGTDPSCVFGMPTRFIQDKQALVALDDSTFKILTIPIPPMDVNQLTDSTVMDLGEKGITGRILIDFSGYFSMEMQEALNEIEQKDLESRMRSVFNRGSNKFHLDSFHVGDQQDKAHIRLTAGFALQDYAKRIGDEWYVNMNLFKFYEHEEIDYPKRKVPIEFPFRFRRRYVTVLNLPAGYDVSYLPAGKTFQNAIWGFSLSYEKRDRQLIFTQEFDNDHLQMPPEMFADWNKVLENLLPLYKETVGLKKNP